MSMALEVKCGSCSKKLPPNLRVINCSTCKSFFHVKCSDINKKEFLTIIDGGNDWNCFKCRPHLTKPNKTRCFDCKKQYLKIEFQLDVQTVQIRIIPLVVVLQSTSLMN